DGGVRNQVSTGDPRAGSALTGQVLQTRERAIEGTFGLLRQVTRNTQFTVASAVEHEVEGTEQYSVDGESAENAVTVRIKANAVEGQAVALSKFIACHTSKEPPDAPPSAGLAAEARQSVEQAKKDRFA